MVGKAFSVMKIATGEKTQDLPESTKISRDETR